MIHLYDRDTIARALTLNLDPRLRELLAARIAALDTEYGDLTDYTEFLVLEPGDTETDIVRHVGFSPLIDPIGGRRWPDPCFKPSWDFLANHGVWFEMIVTFGSTFAYVFFVRDAAGTAGELVTMCRALAAAEPNGR